MNSGESSYERNTLQANIPQPAIKQIPPIGTNMTTARTSSNTQPYNMPENKPIPNNIKTAAIEHDRLLSENRVRTTKPIKINPSEWYI